MGLSLLVVVPRNLEVFKKTKPSGVLRSRKMFTLLFEFPTMVEKKENKT